MVFHWSLSDSKSPYVSRTLLSILANLNNAAVRIVCFSSDLQLLQSFHNLSRPFRLLHLESVSLSLSCNTLSFLRQGPSIYLFFRFLLFSVSCFIISIIISSSSSSCSSITYIKKSRRHLYFSQLFQAVRYFWERGKAEDFVRGTVVFGRVWHVSCC